MRLLTLPPGGKARLSPFSIAQRFRPQTAIDRPLAGLLCEMPVPHTGRAMLAVVADGSRM